ncbi:MAG: hypothetical protein DMF84_09270 [Acidobacteria bacterium]|nr:MAG: hypothetical protein DMF84_09270 [Acidobacteriota bacterium]
MAKKSVPRHKDPTANADIAALSPNDSNDNEPKIARANMERKTVVAENYMSVYANDIQLQTTPWDVRLILGRIIDLPTANDPSATIRQLAEVHMSPQMAKKLTLLLIGQLQIYEKQMGQIPQPTD